MSMSSMTTSKAVDDLWTGDQQADMDDFIRGIILKDPPKPPTDQQAVEDIEAFLGDVIATGRLAQEADMNAQTTEALIRDAENMVQEKEMNEHKVKLQGKVQVFLSMHGCPLLKSMLIARNASYDEFINKIEHKLNETDLTIYYEDNDGDKVEIDDDDSVTLFLSQSGMENKLKLIAFPAELVSTRMARAFATSSTQGISMSARAPPRQGSMIGQMKAQPSTSRGQWQSTMGSVDFTGTTPRTAHGRRSSFTSNYDRAAALSARRISAETSVGATGAA